MTRQRISAWVAALTKAGKSPSTVRYQYSLVRMVLAQAVVDNALASNPADYVKLPTKVSATHDNPASYLTAQQVTAIVAATPWPYNVYVHLAAWAGLRAGELCGLTIADVDLPPSLPKYIAPDSIRPKAIAQTPRGITQARPGQLHVQRSARPLDGVVAYMPPKSPGSRRRVPLTPETAELLRDYLAEHPRAAEPSAQSNSAPLFPGLGAHTPRLGQPTLDQPGQPTLDWANPLRHGRFYQKVFKPAVLRAGLPPTKFHALRHTYASLCVAAGPPPLQISRFMGHTNVTITLGVYAHLFADDHAQAMAALGAMGTAHPAPANADNVVPLRRR